MLEPLRNPANWDNFRKVAVLVLILWAAASVLFGIIYLHLGGPQPCAGEHIQGAYFACPFYRSGRSSDWLKFKNPVQAGSRREMGAVKNRTHFNSPRGYVGG